MKLLAYRYAVGLRTNERDGTNSLLQGEDVVPVLEKYDGLLLHLMEERLGL